MTITTKCSQLKIKDQYGNISGMEIIPCQRFQAECVRQSQKMYQKCTQKGLQIHAKFIINLQKTKYRPFEDNTSKMFTSENQRPV